MKRLATDQERRDLIWGVEAALKGPNGPIVDLASRWYPGKVWHPAKRPRRTFQALEPWAYILDLLRSNFEIEVITLDKPKGADGWVMKVPVNQVDRLIYIKLQLDKDGFAIGRSFHYDDPR
jgi:hypothetical protein